MGSSKRKNAISYDPLHSQTRSTHLVPLPSVLHQLVGDGGGLGEGRDILSNGVEGDFERVGDSSGKLSLGLVTDNGNGAGSLGDSLLDGSGDTRVDTTAKTSVGGDGEVEDLALLGSLLLAGLDLGEELWSLATVWFDWVGGSARACWRNPLRGIVACRRQTAASMRNRRLTVVGGSVLLGLLHGSLGSGELGGSDNLHRLDNQRSSRISSSAPSFARFLFYCRALLHADPHRNASISSIPHPRRDRSDNIEILRDPPW